MKNLNKQQKEAVLNIEGSTRIIAGPGTGKTRTIVEKIKYLIESGNQSHKILAITFTNKAALEMKKRLGETIENKVGFFTFHSLCALMLRISYSDAKVDKNYLIIDGYDQKKLLKEIYRVNKIDAREFPYYEVLKYIEVNNFSRDDSSLEIEKKDEPIYKKIRKEYEKNKRGIKALDFNDLILTTLNLLKKSSSALNYWSSKYDHFLVDEFQDIDNEQFEIVRLLSKKSKSITIVGDPDQTIYGWRGANINIINEFDKYYPHTKTIKLIENYRSTQKIVDIANKSIKFNKNRIDKDLLTKNEEGEFVQGYESYENRYNEAKFIIYEINKLIEDGKTNYKDIAILYRNNFISQLIEQVLIQKNIPYLVHGSFKFFERKEIKETISYLSWLVFQDDYSFENIVNVPSRKFGPMSLEKLKKEANGKSYWSYINKNSIEKIADLKNVSNKYISEANNKFNARNFSDLFRNFLEEIGIFNLYRNDEDKTENINEFLKNLQKKINEDLDSIEDFNYYIREYLNYISLLQSNDATEDANSVSLMTIHASKGKEFEVLFVIGLNENIIPSRRSVSSGLKSIEEERRLFYVAITRAKKRLFLTWNIHKDFNGELNFESRFISEIKNKLLIKSEINRNTIENDKNENEFEKGRFKKINEENSNISEGDVIYHSEWGEGVVIVDEGEIIEVAFSHKIGVKRLIKKHRLIKLIS